MRAQRTLWYQAWAMALALGLGGCDSEAPGTESARGSFEPSTLDEAVLMGNRTAVENFLALGIDPNEAEPDGTTPLMRAVHGRYLDIAEALIAASASVRARNSYGVTALYIAARGGDAAAARLLLAAGADANTMLPASGETVLMTAAKSGDPEVVRVLLTGGTNVPLLSLAEQRAAVQVAESAGYGAQTNPATRTNFADVNARERWYGRTALMVAAVEGHADIVRLLIEAGSDVGLLDEEGASALSLARGYGHLDVAAELEGAGAR